MDVYRTPEERFAGLPGYPFEPRYLERDGLRMHYLDEGTGDPVLLLHGQPTWSFLYRKLIPPLAAVARVVAPDYLGFGRSDKPTRVEDYSYDFHVESVRRLVDGLDLRAVTVVVQDWGGPIGLRLAVEQPERFARLVILNTGLEEGALSEEWFRYRDFVRRVGTGLEPGRLVALSCAGGLGDDVVRGYDAPFPTPESKAGVLAFAELVPADVEHGHPSAARWVEVRAAVERWDRPALVLFSDSDPVFAAGVAERMAARIPGAGPAETVAGAGHFLQEEKGEQIAERIVRFLHESA